jgi:hypothetical protein
MYGAEEPGKVGGATNPCTGLNRPVPAISFLF